jgi:hypothetical protein
LNALDELDPEKKGVTQRRLKDRARISHRDLSNAIFELNEQKIIEIVPVTYKSGNGATRTTDGIRRRLRTNGGNRGNGESTASLIPP